MQSNKKLSASPSLRVFSKQLQIGLRNDRKSFVFCRYEFKFHGWQQLQIGTEDGSTTHDKLVQISRVPGR
jgi:hypothetical protein